MTPTTRRLFIHGRVQGVGFRYSLNAEARALSSDIVSNYEVQIFFDEFFICVIQNILSFGGKSD